MSGSDLPERDTRVVPAAVTLVLPAGLTVRARMAALAAVEEVAPHPLWTRRSLFVNPLD